MVAFQDELVWKLVEIDVVEAGPHAKCLDDVLLSEFFGGPFFGSNLVYQGGVEGVTVVELEPLELFR